MAYSIKSLLAIALGASATLVFAPAHANDANGERDTSVYDKNPDCLNRGQVAPGQPAPCELLVPPSGRRPIARAPATATAAAGGTAGAQASASASTGSTVAGNTSTSRSRR